MATVDDIQVSLVDDEEDLLEYDDTPEENAEERLKGDSNGVDSSGVDSNEVDSNEARKAAEMLLKKEPPCVTVSYDTDIFLLFDCDDQSDEIQVASIICEKDSDLYDSCNGLFTSIRRFLEKFYGSITFLSKEILLEIPCLDIVLCEDNIYNSQITFDDIATIFSILRKRSEKQLEQNIPQRLEIKLAVRPRFVSRYNALVELTQTAATLGNIKPFTNDSSHPLILDDGGVPAATAEENMIMDVDDESENVQEQKPEGYRPLSEDKQVSSHDKAMEDDSDELLEIVDEELEDSSNTHS